MNVGISDRIAVEDLRRVDLAQFAEALQLPPSIAAILIGRGVDTAEAAGFFLNPLLERLQSPHVFSQMETAVSRLLAAVRAEQPVAIYADRDVDGLSGLAILARTLRSIGGIVRWGSPMKGRGLEREVLERLVNSGAKVLVLVDCGTGEHAPLTWLQAQGVDVIVADHHRMSEPRPPALAWIHPDHLGPQDEAESRPAGCVMAFKLAQAIWLSFLGENDPERMDYFLFSHLDLICLGILADRMPLTGENRILVWHGLRRLAYSRKAGISALTRFFRLTPRSGPLSVREVTWRLIPLLNAGGRLGRPDLTAEFLVTEDSDRARQCIDELLALNTRRRTAQDKSLISFEKAVLEQCDVESDPVLVALTENVEPSVTGLAAQSLVRKYGRPTFLFVSQGDEAVGSGRGLPDVDLFGWVEAQQDCIVKFGGHQGAVGMTIRTADFEAFRRRLLATAREDFAGRTSERAAVHHGDVSAHVEASVALHELDEFWWISLERLGPFGTGHPWPLFQLDGVESILSERRRRSKSPLQEVLLRNPTAERKARIDWDHLSARGRLAVERISAGDSAGPWNVTGHPVAVPRNGGHFDWMIRDLWRTDG